MSKGAEVKSLRQDKHADGDPAATAEQTFAQLKAQIETLRSDLATLAETARDGGYETARDAVRGARRMGRRTAGKAEAGYDFATDQLEEAMARTGNFARERPFVTLGVAAGAGFLLALTLLRR
jgi:ElaB/YqjD/DUF883 family membrane-anchored ribosome-binding protein